MLISIQTFFLLLDSEDLDALFLWHSAALCPESTILRATDGTLQIV